MKFKTGMDVRIGYPTERLASEKNVEVNQPMYATSIGLLLKGAEFLREKNETISVSKPVAAVTPEPIVKSDEVQEAETVSRDKKAFGKTKIFDNIRAAITDIFDENDSRM